MAEDTNRSGSLYGGMAEPCAVVLFGASGDLAKRKVIPAMFDLANHNSLGSRYVIVGFARTPMSDENFRATTGEAAKTMSEIGPVDPKTVGRSLPLIFITAPAITRIRRPTSNSSNASRNSKPKKN